MKSIFKSVAIITVFSILTRLLGFIFRIYLSRTIGAEALGIYQVSLSVLFVLLTFVSSGLPLIISRMVASFRVSNDKKAESRLVSTSLLFSGILSIILCLIVILFQGIFKNLFTDESCMMILIILLPSLVFSSFYCVFRGALWGKDNYFALCISELFEQIVKIIICVILLGKTLSVVNSAISVAWAFTLSCVASAIFVMVLYFVYGGRLSKPSNIYKSLIKQSAPITGIRAVGSFVQPLVAFMIPNRLVKLGYTNTQALSIYGIAVGMTLPLLYLPNTLIGSLSTALIPDISMAVAENNTNHIEKRIQSSLTFSIFVSSIAVPVYIGLGEMIGQFLYADILSGTLLMKSAWIMIPMGITNITSALLNSLGYEIKSFVNYICGALAMFLCIWFLTSFAGINALAIGLGLCAIITSFLNIRMLKQKTKVSINILKPLIKIVLIILPCSALTSFVGSLLSFIFPTFIVLILAGMISVITFILLCIIFNIVDISSYYVAIKNKLKFKKNKVKS